LGGDTIIPRWPLPIGDNRSMILVVVSAEPEVSSRSLSSGNSGVRSSKRGRLRASSGVSPDESREFLVRCRGAARPLDVVPPPQGETPRLADRHVYVTRARQVPLGAQETVTLVAQVQKSPDRHELTRVLRLCSPALKLAVGRMTTGLASPPAPAPPIAGFASSCLVLLATRSGNHPRARGGGDLVHLTVACGDLGPVLGPLRVGRLRVLPVGSCGGARPLAGLHRASCDSCTRGQLAVAVARARGKDPARGAQITFAVTRTRTGNFNSCGPQDLVDDVGLLRARIHLQRHRLGDHTEFVAFLAFEYGPLELLLCSHVAPR
jgi:hypothetical protein